MIILPAGLNSSSSSGWVMLFGKPHIYKFAPFILSLLGRAYETWSGEKGKMIDVHVPRREDRTNMLFPWFQQAHIHVGQESWCQVKPADSWPLDGSPVFHPAVPQISVATRSSVPAICKPFLGNKTTWRCCCVWKGRREKGSVGG